MDTQPAISSVDFNAAPESFALRRKWLASLNVAPHVSLCGRISTPGGHGADWADTATTKMIVTPAAARKAVNDIVAYKADCFGETMIDGWRYGLSPDNTSMDLWTLSALVDEAEWSARIPATLSAEHALENAHDLGRELFGGMRRNVKTAEEGAVTWL